MTLLDYNKIIIRDVELHLLEDKSLYVPAEKMLVISDLHLGKAVHFNKYGMAIPAHHDEVDLHRMNKQICATNCEKVLFLGDLFHSDYNMAWEKLKSFVEGYPHIEFHLTIGNHDILADHQYDFLYLHRAYCTGDIIFTHEPLPAKSLTRYNIYGHIHPGVKLVGKGKKSIKMPCFFVSETYMVMPAYGSFTGLYILRPTKNDTVYVTDGTFIKQMH